jgi:hypothetical protein
MGRATPRFIAASLLSEAHSADTIYVRNAELKAATLSVTTRTIRI